MVTMAVTIMVTGKRGIRSQCQCPIYLFIHHFNSTITLPSSFGMEGAEEAEPPLALLTLRQRYAPPY